jgi:hypothetical protein
MGKSDIVRRIERLEVPVAAIKLHYVLYEEFNDVYLVGTERFSVEQFEAWKATLGDEDETILVEIVCNAKGTEQCNGSCSYSKCAARQDVNYRFRVFHGQREDDCSE